MPDGANVWRSAVRSGVARLHAQCRLRSDERRHRRNLARYRSRCRSCKRQSHTETERFIAVAECGRKRRRLFASPTAGSWCGPTGHRGGRAVNRTCIFDLGVDRWWFRPQPTLRQTSGIPGISLRRYREIETRWLQAEQSWKARAGAKEFDALRSNLASLKTEYEGLAAEEKQRIQEYTANRRSEQLRIYLEGFQIRRAKIAHVGPAKLATLTSYGIETAADVSAVAVQNVPGFGPVNSLPLVEWRANLERRFVYNANPTQADTVSVNRIRAEIANRASHIKAELGTGPERLRNMARARIQQLQEKADPTLQHLNDQRTQALADLRCIGISPPTVTLPSAPTASLRTQPTITNAGGQSPRCPSCGSPMILRTARRGRNAGSRFLGCTRYPQCTGTRSVP